LVADILFSQTVDCSRAEIPEYGTAHPDTTRWPNHKFVYFEPLQGKEAGGREELFTFYYAADRESQDDYNWEDVEGASMIRTYLIPRDEYTREDAPTVGTADEVFDMYVFAMETVQRVPEPLDSMYVAVKRVYLPPERTDLEYNDTFERIVATTRRIVPHGDGVAVSSAGSVTEVQDVNTWYDLEITREIQLVEEETFPYSLPDLPVDVPYRFPPRLNAVNLVWANAYAFATGQPDSYSEDYYFDLDIDTPYGGPYEGTLLRFITDDPDGLRATYPVIKIMAKQDNLAVVAAWYSASTDGNSTFAIAREVDLPATIHDEIEVTKIAVTTETEEGELQFKGTLPATPDYDAIVAATEMVVGYDVKKLPLNLYEVSITLINTTGLYP
jgi:hypothetical protein